MITRGVPTNSTRSCQGARIQREAGCRLCAVAPDETDRATILIGKKSDQRGARSARREFSLRAVRAPHHIVTNSSERELRAELEEPPLEQVHGPEPHARRLS